MELYQAMKNRRTNYTIGADSPISDERISEIVKAAVQYTPSSFHSQSSRVVVLFGEEHQKLWQIVKDTLRAIVPEAAFPQTEGKINSFAAGHGTILYYEEQQTVKKLQEGFPLYADNFPVWSNQSSGMLQYAIWTALTSEGLGVSLQHYNPIIDEAVATAFELPQSWKLIAQMPFGTPVSDPGPLEYLPNSERVVVRG